MDCQQARAELLPLAFDGLEDADRVALEAHLKDCQKCGDRSGEVADALGLLEGPADRAPEGVLESLLSRIAEQEAREASRRDAEPEIRIAVSCIYCKDGLKRPEAVFCGSCLAPHHPSCFEEHGKCANIGCEETRTVRPLDPREPLRPATAQHVHSGKGAKGGKPGMSGKGAEPRRRSRIPRLIGVMAASTVLGVALVSMRDRPAKLDDMAPLKPVKALKVTPDPSPALPGAGPILASLRSTWRQVLPADIVDVAVDRQGVPWFTRRPAVTSVQTDHLFLALGSTLEEQQKGAGELVLFGATYRGQDDLGRAVVEFVVAGEGFNTSYESGLWTGPKPQQIESGSVTLASRCPFPADRLPPGLELPAGAEVKAVDGFGRIYVTELLEAGRRVVVYDLWAEGRMPRSQLFADAVASMSDGAAGLVAQQNSLTVVDAKTVGSMPLPGRSAVLEVKLGGVLLIEGEDPVTAKVQLWRPTSFDMPIRKQILGETQSSGRDLLSALRLDPFISEMTPVNLETEPGLGAALQRLAEWKDGLRPGPGELCERPVVVDPKQRVWWFGKDALSIISAKSAVVHPWSQLESLGEAPRGLRFAGFNNAGTGFYAEIVAGGSSRSIELDLSTDGALRCAPIAGAMSAVEAAIVARLDGTWSPPRRSARVVHVSDTRVFQLVDGVLSATRLDNVESFLLRDLSPNVRVVPGDGPRRLLVIDAPGGTLTRLAMIEESLDRGLSPTILWQRKAPSPIVLDRNRAPVVADGRLFVPKASAQPEFEVLWLEPHLVGARR